MIRDTYSNIENGIDVRQNLSLLRQELKDESNLHALLYYLEDHYDVLIQKLSDEDAKTRKNAALVLGALGVQKLLPELMNAYENETQMFVKSAYLIAAKEFDYREYMPLLKERLNELTNQTNEEQNKKHVMEEVRALTDLIVTMEGVKLHKFTGFHEKSDLVLLTNRNHIDVTMDQITSTNKKAFNAGIMVEINDLNEILELRTVQEILFRVDGMKTCPLEPFAAAKQIVTSDLVNFMKQRHAGKAPYYFRVEYKTKLPLDKKSQFTKRLSSEIQQLSNGTFVNNTSNYEFEIRIIENKEGQGIVFVKLFTLKDNRFEYRKQVLPVSIRPTNAALTVLLAKDYLKEDAQVLDPFCGVGTMLIERHKLVKANTTYGIDSYAGAIEKARENTEAARQIIHYINRDFFDFKHEYLFDEIITDMPFAQGRKKEEEIEELYSKFFLKAKEHLKEDGMIIMYSHDKELVQKLSVLRGYQIIKMYEISKLEGTYVFILQVKR